MCVISENFLRTFGCGIFQHLVSRELMSHSNTGLLVSVTQFFFFPSRDEVETQLVAEVQELRDNVSALQDMLSEVRNI
jgi:hypothetical protein